MILECLDESGDRGLGRWADGPQGLGSSLAISQEELAYLCGLSRQRVNQALHLLEGAKLVHVDYGSVTVLNLEGLREFDL